MLTAAAQKQLHPEFSSTVLDVITPVVNPKRYASRYRLFNDFAEYCSRFPNVRLTPVEMAFGERDFVIAHPNVVRVRGSHELWHKENLVNIAAARLPADAKYIAWVDGDVTFAREDWALETLHLLQHYAVVQMFSHATDLGPDHEPIQQHVGLVHTVEKSARVGKDIFDGSNPAYSSYFGHPGYAWAFRREAWDGLGGMLDTAVIGAGDHHMALGLFGQAHHSLFMEREHPYSEPVLLWQERAERVVKRNVGVMPGALLHYWHGKKADRRYLERRSIILNNRFDPRRDLIRDAQGLWQLSGDNIGLRDDLRRYFAARNEDSIDL